MSRSAFWAFLATALLVLALVLAVSALQMSERAAQLPYVLERTQLREMSFIFAFLAGGLGLLAMGILVHLLNKLERRV